MFGTEDPVFFFLVWMQNVSRVHAAIPVCAGWAGFHYLHLCGSSWALIFTSRRLLGAISFSFNMCVWRFVHLASPFNLIDMLLPCFVCSRLCRDFFPSSSNASIMLRLCDNFYCVWTDSENAFMHACLWGGKSQWLFHYVTIACGTCGNALLVQ